MGKKSLGTLQASGKTFSYVFEYKYVLGFCTKSSFKKGDGPTLSIFVGRKKVWTYTIDLNTEDYPHDALCGGSPTNYSPWVQAAFEIPANLGGEVILTMAANNRNIHIVGHGMKCALSGIKF